MRWLIRKYDLNSLLILNNKSRTYEVFSQYVSYTGHTLLVVGGGQQLPMWQVAELQWHCWKCTVALILVLTSLWWHLSFFGGPASIFLTPNFGSGSSFGPSFWHLLPLVQADMPRRRLPEVGIEGTLRTRPICKCSDLMNLTSNKANRLRHRGFLCVVTARFKSQVERCLLNVKQPGLYVGAVASVASQANRPVVRPTLSDRQRIWKKPLKNHCLQLQRDEFCTIRLIGGA